MTSPALAVGPSHDALVAKQLTEVADRLCREFAPAGGEAAETVRRQVREARAGFHSPKVLTFLPVLVERNVRRQLRERPLPQASLAADGEVEQ